MNRINIIIVIIFIIIIILRILSQGGLGKPSSDPEFEAIVGQFEPLRNYLSGAVNELLPQPQAGLLNGMLLGVKSSLPAEFNQALRRTSTIHIVVVSGQNLSLVAGFCLGLVGFLGRKKTLILALLVSIFYAILTGLQVPVLRALIMVSLAFIAQFFGREKEGVWVLLLTAGLMLIYNPYWLLSISFQLSFLATVGVVVVAPEIVKRLNFLPDLAKQDLAVSIAAQALTWPIIAANFHQASIIGILVNSLILFTVPIIMISGAVALLISLISPVGLISQISALIPGIFLTYFVYVVQVFNQKWGSLYVGYINWAVWVGYYILILAIYLTLRKNLKLW